ARQLYDQLKKAEADVARLAVEAQASQCNSDRADARVAEMRESVENSFEWVLGAQRDCASWWLIQSQGDVEGVGGTLPPDVSLADAVFGKIAEV
ncbi:unnamed protein product, partial [marine sediment metagenome]